MQKAQINALNVHNEVRSEADRLFRDELDFLKTKLEKTDVHLLEYEEKLENLASEFF
jgi:ferredoxin-NADP reductase